jgi:MFS transporter, putative metabolite:H+ symporter
MTAPAVAEDPVTPSAHVPGRIARPGLFWTGIGLLVLGVALVFIEYAQTRVLSLLPSQVGVTPLAAAGVVFDLVGMVLAGIGLMPRAWRAQEPVTPPAGSDASDGTTSTIGLPADRSGLLAIDTAVLTATHWLMLIRLFIGLILDTMKPATIGFVLPGMKAEYAVTAAQVSLFPATALAGTTIGAILFGYLADIIGRRASFMLTAVLFAGSAVCGLMPSFEWQLATCFLMGLAAGGELPLIYAMLAETMPARHRGWLSVTVAGVGGLTGLLLASWLALLLEPTFTWRSLFLPNLPTALFMLLLLKWIPESPRYLLLRGFGAEARRAMSQVGVSGPGTLRGGAAPLREHSPREMFAPGLRGTTLTLSSYGLAWGLCNWGFVTFLPTMLRDNLGLDAAAASGLLAGASLMALPGTLAAAALFAFWSSKKTAVLAGAITCLAIAGFGLGQPLLVERMELIQLVLVAVLIASSSMVGVLAPYSVELFPTALRGVGSGVVSASSKLGGLFAPGVMGGLLTLVPGLLVPALVVAVPVGVATVLMAARAPETRGKRLEELSGEEAPALTPAH